MNWETKITKVEPNHLVTRGFKQQDLIGNVSFGEVLYLLLKGNLPTKNEGRMMEAIIVSCIDHGVTAPSCVTTRTVASCGVPLPTAISAGLLAVGDNHGGAIENAMKMLQDAVLTMKKANISSKEMAKEIVEKFINNKTRIAGLGHRFHTKDPRTTRIFQLAEELLSVKTHVTLFKDIQNTFSEIKGNNFPINVDGAIAAITSDMGFDPILGKTFFLIGRSAGLTAHAYEEITTQKPVRTIVPKDAIYTGPEEQKLEF